MKEKLLPKDTSIGMSGKDVPAVDLLKFLFSLCVIVLHTVNFHGMSEENLGGLTISYICNNAVPYFFAVSGYFMTRKIHGYLAGEKGGLKPLFRFWRKILWLYIFWCVSRYIFLLVCGMPFQSTIKDSIIVFFCAGYDVYWYLWSILCFIPLYMLFMKYYRHFGRSYSFIFMIVIILMVLMIYMGADSLDDLKELLPIKWFIYIQSNIYCLSMILYGLMFFLIGSWFAVTGNRWISPLGALLFIVAGFICVYWQENIGNIGYFNIKYMGRVLFTFGIISLVFSWKPKISSSVSLTLRKMSAWIYFTHCFVITLYIALKLDPRPVVALTVVYGVTISLAYLIVRLSERPYFIWLNRLM